MANSGQVALVMADSEWAAGGDLSRPEHFELESQATKGLEQPRARARDISKATERLRKSKS